MKTIEVFSKKIGKNVSVVKSSNTSSMGWMNSGWSKSGGWKVPCSK